MKRTLDVMVVPVGREPEPRTLESDENGSFLKALQGCVGGLIEPLSWLFGDAPAGYCNEEGALGATFLDANRAVYADKAMEDAGFLSQLDFATPVCEGDLYAIVFGVSATAKSAERATLSRRRRPRFPAGGATALWPPALPRAAAQGALDRGVVEVRGPDLNLQRRGALGVPGRDRPARDLPSAELREPDRHRDVLCAERGQPPRGVRGPHDCPLSGSPSPSAASASRSFMR